MVKKIVFILNNILCFISSFILIHIVNENLLNSLDGTWTFAFLDAFLFVCLISSTQTLNIFFKRKQAKILETLKQLKSTTFYINLIFAIIFILIYSFHYFSPQTLCALIAAFIIFANFSFGNALLLIVDKNKD